MSDAQPAQKKPRKPKGWQAYDGKRITGTVGLGRAADATLRDQTGAAVTMTSLWKGGKALVVFYRGHW